MTTLLIVESNTPDMVYDGLSGAFGFVRAFAHIDPQVQLRLAAPHGQRFEAAQLEGIDGVIFTGAGVAWGVDAPEGAALARVMEITFAAGLPVWGSCNGMQLAAWLLGGRLGDCPNGLELGMARDLQLTESGQSHPMFVGRNSGFAVPCIHRHEVTALGSDMVLLAGNAHTGIQAVSCQSGGVDFWGTQYHPELALSDIAAYLQTGRFADTEGVLSKLLIADRDEAAAGALGTSQAELSVRTLELANWLGHVKARGLS